MERAQALDTIAIDRFKGQFNADHVISALIEPVKSRRTSGLLAGGVGSGGGAKSVTAKTIPAKFNTNDRYA